MSNKGNYKVDTEVLMGTSKQAEEATKPKVDKEALEASKKVKATIKNNNQIVVKR